MGLQYEEGRNILPRQFKLKWSAAQPNRSGLRTDSLCLQTAHDGAADVFLDVASGSNVVNRPEFQRMLQSAQSGKINYVITKSVSRFGRSTKDVLVATRALKECGAESTSMIRSSAVSTLKPSN